MLSLMLAALVTPAPPPLPMQWAEFSRAGELNGVQETVAIAMDQTHGSGLFQYRLRLTKTVIGKSVENKWTDSESCPAIREIIVGMHDMAMPTMAPYGSPWASGMIVIDGTDYSLTAPSSFPAGTVTVTSNTGSPLATWVDNALSRLAPCWKDGQE